MNHLPNGVEELAEEEKPVGELFSLVYCQRGTPLEDSERFRRRLGGYLLGHVSDLISRAEVYQFIHYLTTETGLEIPLRGMGSVADFLLNVEVTDLLNCITLIWRYFRSGSRLYTQGEMWRNFVKRALKEENMRYRLDPSCGVHYLIDEAFEANRVAILPALQDPRYAGVRDAFETAYQYLSSDTKAAARSMFESLEIMARLMVTGQKNLNGWLVLNKLKPMALTLYEKDKTASTVTEGFFEGLAKWVDSVHNYRHGQGQEEPVSPPLDLCVYILSSGTSFLRWLIDVDQRTKSS